MARQLFKKDSSHKLCVHVRRGDFKSFGGETTEEFVLGSVDYATAYLKNKLNVKKSSIVIMGDDQDFIKNVSRKLEHKTYIPKNTSRGEDICFAIHNCNSLIISAGSSTFGWWIGYLKKLPGPHTKRMIKRNPSTKVNSTRKLAKKLRANCPDFISVDTYWRNNDGEWPPNSPNLNPLDYSVWSILEEKACAKPHPNVESLKRALKKAWNEITLETLIKIVDNFPKRLKACMDAKGGHFE
uniref:Uncharacterized protein n=1 Tax=Acrobeloides nanus TaxID=290746 RepID=A0A914DY47_9BILA